MRQDEVRERPRGGHDRLAPAAELEVHRVDRSGFCPPEPECVARRRRPDERQSEQRPTDRVEMGDRIERQAPEQLGGAVTQPVGRERVAEFVDREPDEQA